MPTPDDFTIEAMDEGPIGFCVACHRAVPVGDGVETDAMGFTACPNCEKRYKPRDEQTYARLPFETKRRWWMEPRPLAVMCLLTVLLGWITANAFGASASRRLRETATGDNVDAEALVAGSLSNAAGGVVAAFLSLLLIPWLALCGGLFLAWFERAYEPNWLTAAACLVVFYTAITFGYGGSVWLTAVVLAVPVLVLYARVSA